MAEQLGAAYDPAVVEQALSWGTTEAGRLTAQKNANDDYQAALRLEEEGKKNAPETFQKWVSAYANTMAVARTPEEWQGLRELGRRGGVPPTVLGMLPEQFRPDAPDVAAREEFAVQLVIREHLQSRIKVIERLHHFCPHQEASASDGYVFQVQERLQPRLIRAVVRPEHGLLPQWA